MYKNPEGEAGGRFEAAAVSADRSARFANIFFVQGGDDRSYSKSFDDRFKAETRLGFIDCLFGEKRNVDEPSADVCRGAVYTVH